MYKMGVHHSYEDGGVVGFSIPEVIPESEGTWQAVTICSQIPQWIEKETLKQKRNTTLQ